MNTAELTALNPDEGNFRDSTWRDWLGIVASVGCAIHCAAMPFVIAYLPALGLSFLADEGFHKWMALVCFLIAIVAFVPGIKTHGNWMPISIGAIGLTLIAFAAFGLAGECCPSCESQGDTADKQVEAAIESHECEHCQSHATEVSIGAKSAGVIKQGSFLSAIAPWVTPLGGLLLVSAHLLNRRFGCLCGCCERPLADPAIKPSTSAGD